MLRSQFLPKKFVTCLTKVHAGYRSRFSTKRSTCQPGMYRSLYLSHTHTPTHRHTHIPPPIPTHTHLHIQTYTSTHTPIHTRTHTPPYTHPHTHPPIHTHTHTHTHTHYTHTHIHTYSDGISTQPGGRSRRLSPQRSWRELGAQWATTVTNSSATTCCRPLCTSHGTVCGGTQVA